MTFKIYGPSYSTYVRSARLVCEEKGAAYDLVEVDMFGGAHRQEPHLGRQPFGFVPAFEDDGFALYETGAVMRYVDRIAAGPTLTPAEARSAARMDQIMAIVDAYAYPALIGTLVKQRIVAPMRGGTTDEAVIEQGMDRVQTSLRELERLKGDHPFMAGTQLSLADLLLAPIFAYFTQTPEAARIMPDRPGLRRWWDAIQSRPSMAKTAPQLA